MMRKQFTVGQEVRLPEIRGIVLSVRDQHGRQVCTVKWQDDTITDCHAQFLEAIPCLGLLAEIDLS